MVFKRQGNNECGAFDVTIQTQTLNTKWKARDDVLCVLVWQWRKMTFIGCCNAWVPLKIGKSWCILNSQLTKCLVYHQSVEIFVLPISISAYKIHACIVSQQTPCQELKWSTDNSHIKRKMHHFMIQMSRQTDTPASQYDTFFYRVRGRARSRK